MLTTTQFADLTNRVVANFGMSGARVLVAGSALFRDPDGLEHAVADLRHRGEEACR